MSKAFHHVGCKRPLPPPQSREAVISQIGMVLNWTTIDNCEDIRICTPHKRVRIGECCDKGRMLGQCLGHGPTSNGPRADDLRPGDKNNSIFNFSGSASRKKSLFGSEARRRQVQAQNRIDLGILANNGQGLPASKQQNGTHNSGGWSFERLPASRTISSQHPDNEQEEAVRLAIATNADLPYHETKTTFPNLEQPSFGVPECNDIVPGDQEIDDTLIERSRQLREKALARRYRAEQCSESDPRSHPTHPSPLGEGANTIGEEDDAEDQINPSVRQYASPDPDKNVGSNSNGEPVAPADIDHLFDIAEAAADTEEFSMIREKTKHYRHTSAHQSQHPASRTAAELYRTQDRHLTHKALPRLRSPQSLVDLQESERRLRLLTSLTYESPTVAENGLLDNAMELDNQMVPLGSALQGLKPASVMLDNQSETIGDTENTSERADDSEILSGTATTIEIPHRPQVHTTSSNTSNILASFPASILSSPFPPLRMEKSHANTTQQLVPKESEPGTLEDYAAYPKNPPGLTLPSKFGEYDEETQAIILEHERKKEMERDLAVIIPTFEQIARLGSLDQFKQNERNELRTVQEYTRAVVDQGLSGKRMRNRITGIRDNMKRRIQRLSPPEDYEFERLLNTLLKEERREHIVQLLSTIRNQLDRLRYDRAEATAKRFSKKSKPILHNKGNPKDKPSKVRHMVTAADILTDLTKSFSDLADGSEIELPNSSLTEPKPLSLTEKKRNAQFAAADRKEAMIRAKLMLFEESTHVSQPNSGELMESMADTIDEQSEVSEEEEGAEHFSHPKLLTPPPDNLTRVITNKSPSVSVLDVPQRGVHKGSETRPQSSQTHDQDLAMSMVRKQSQRDILEQHSSQLPDCELRSTNIETDVVDSTLQDNLLDTTNDTISTCELDDMSDSYSDDGICYRYIVKAQHAGIPCFDEGYEYSLKKCLDPTLARETLEKHVERLRKFKELEGNAIGAHPTIFVEFKEERGLISQRVEFGEDARSSCHIWIEQEEYKPSAEAYRYAKVYRACHAKPVYIVLWKRTITPIPPPTNDGATIHNHQKLMSTRDRYLTNQMQSIAETDDELFGPELPEVDIRSPAPAPAHEDLPGSIIETIQVDAVRHFSNIAGANRHAKDVFMRWYMDHLRGRENFHYITGEERAVEIQLKGCGDRDTWAREEDFDVYTDVEVETEDEVNNVMVKRERRIKHNDKFKVWVEMRRVKGPAN